MREFFSGPPRYCLAEEFVLAEQRSSKAVRDLLQRNSRGVREQFVISCSISRYGQKRFMAKDSLWTRAVFCRNRSRAKSKLSPKAVFRQKRTCAKSEPAPKVVCDRKFLRPWNFGDSLTNMVARQIHRSSAKSSLWPRADRCQKRDLDMGHVFWRFESN